MPRTAPSFYEEFFSLVRSELPSLRLDTAKRPVRHCARVEKSHKCTDTPAYAHIENVFLPLYTFDAYGNYVAGK